MKKLTSIITILLLTGLILIGGGCKKDNLDDSVSIETKIINAINQAKETGAIVLTEEIRTPSYWVSFMVSDNICLAVIGEKNEEWPIFLKRADYEIKLIAATGIMFEVVCGQETGELRRKIAERYEFTEIDFRVIKIEESCKLNEGEKCLLVLTK